MTLTQIFLTRLDANGIDNWTGVAHQLDTLQQTGGPIESVFIGTNRSNANNVNIHFRVFVMLRKIYSSFYSCSFCNDCDWEKVFVGQSASHDLAKPTVATTKSPHIPTLFLWA